MTVHPLIPDFFDRQAHMPSAYVLRTPGAANNLASDFLETGRGQQALVWFTRAAELCRQLYGKESRNAAALANLFAARGSGVQ